MVHGEAGLLSFTSWEKTVLGKKKIEYEREFGKVRKFYKEYVGCNKKMQ